MQIENFYDMNDNNWLEFRYRVTPLTNSIRIVYETKVIGPLSGRGESKTARVDARGGTIKVDYEEGTKQYRLKGDINGTIG